LTGLALLAAGMAAAKEPEPPLLDLVRAERAFAQTSVEQGVKSAFLAFMADDAIVFRPNPVNAQSWYGEQPDVPGTLNWEPAWADISAAGDLGFTTGPFQYRVGDADDERTAHGHYVSVWKKQPDGNWRVVIDLGNSHEAPPDSVRKPTWPDPRPAIDTSEIDLASERAGLLEVDSDFSTSSARNGIATAFASFASKGVRLYREGRLPLRGRVPAVELLSQESATLSWQPTAAQVAASGDLGYTYGTAERTDRAGPEPVVESGNYVRIWSRKPGGEWRLVLDILVPLPPAS
jgi:ketosteroid isomerase-like protein